MGDGRDSIDIAAGQDTEALVNFIFGQLADDVVDQIDLERITPEGTGIARELVTTTAVLTFASALAVPIIGLIARWMEIQRQRTAIELIYKAVKENSGAVKELVELEKLHAQLSVKFEIAKGKRKQ